MSVDVYGCAEASCGHLFVHPRPSAEQIASAYSHYPTHSTKALVRPLLSRIYSSIADLAGMVDGLRAQKAELSLMGLRAETPMRLLDVGCGSGLFLLRMRDHGWCDCFGIDTDPQAVAAARRRGLFNVECKSIDDLIAEGRNGFAVITLNHVVEHFLLPEREFRSIRSLLSEDGRVIVRTPNLRSLFSRLFGRYWRGLEPPRHLNVFTIRSLEMLTTRCGFAVASSKTSNAMMQGIFLESIDGATRRWPPLAKMPMRVFARLVFPIIVFVVSAVHQVFPDTGEEIVTVLRPRVTRESDLQ